ncbi:hypothetical protein D1872_227620 [compost metagenome]
MQRITQNSEGASANPSKAPAVMMQLTSVTCPVPNRFNTAPLARLDTIVPAATIMNSIPAVSNGAPKSGRMTGQAAPSKESGSPRLIKAR